MSDEKRFDIYTELLHTGIGITEYGKEMTGNDVVDMLNQFSDDYNKLVNDYAELNKELRKKQIKITQLAVLVIDIENLIRDKCDKEINEELQEIVKRWRL